MDYNRIIMMSAYLQADFQEVDKIIRRAGFEQVTLYLDDWPSFAASIVYRNKKGERLDLRSTKMGDQCFELHSGVDSMSLDGIWERYTDLSKLIRSLDLEAGCIPNYFSPKSRT